jgi:hypothetical protein
MAISQADRTAHFLRLIEARWPGRAALDARETAEAMRDIFAVTDSYEMVRRQLKAGEIIPGLRRRNGKWIIPVLDLADCMAQRLVAEEAPFPIRPGPKSANSSVSTPPPGMASRRARKVVPSTIGFVQHGGWLELAEPGEASTRWTWAAEPVATQKGDGIEGKRQATRQRQSHAFWETALTALSQLDAEAREAETLKRHPAPVSGKIKDPNDGRA